MTQEKNKKEAIDVIFERLDNIDRKIVEIEQMISDILRDKRIRDRTDDE
jgi:prefoldin subunit 5